MTPPASLHPEPPRPERTQPERIQKVLARAGLGSRRTVETWIAAGRVSINARPAVLGDRVARGDRVEVDGKHVSARTLYGTERTRVWGYYKPAGVLCTRRDDSDRPTVFDALPRELEGRWVHIGRLDFNTSGLLLFTNDGTLAHRLMHPGTGIEREYAVRLRGTVDDRMIARLRGGVRLEDGPARFESITIMGGTAMGRSGVNQWYGVIVKEGRNRLVRRLWESQGVTVSRLMRVRFGPSALPRERRAGEWWELVDQEVQALQNVCGAPLGTVPADGRPPAKPVPRGRPRLRAKHPGPS